ncbi:heavy-metal-associated domain-containing protein [Kribbella swartbergensis]
MSVDACSSDDPYDRARAARILFDLAMPGLFANIDVPPPDVPRIEYRSEPVARALGSHLSTAQLDYVRRSMQGCPPYLVTSAGGRVTWRDSQGIVNVAHTGPLGAVVPVIAREATLVLWQLLATDATLERRVAALDEADVRLLSATTTDRVPLEIFRTGVDAAAKALVQHAYLAAQTPYPTPPEFARGLRDSGIFETVANTWYWGLQASTYRRGIIPVSFVALADRLRYSTDAVIALRAMKDARLQQAQERAHRTTGPGPDGLMEVDAVPASVAHYARLSPGERPRCLAQMPQMYDGQRLTVLSAVADAFVETFVRLVEVIEVERAVVEHGDAAPPARAEVFEVPDMTCSHCTRTITRVLGELGVAPPEFDLVTKKVIAVFPSKDVRARGFEAIRRCGYTVVPLE